MHVRVLFPATPGRSDPLIKMSSKYLVLVHWQRKGYENDDKGDEEEGYYSGEVNTCCAVELLRAGDGTQQTLHLICSGWILTSVSISD